jgi:hypothetical protein
MPAMAVTGVAMPASSSELLSVWKPAVKTVA